MDGRLSGKVAVVTGAGRNIGRAEALALAAEGARILVNDVAAAEETVAAISSAGGEAVANADDVGAWAGAEATIAAALQAFGRIDILVNNAGVSRPSPIGEMSEADWDAVVDVSLKGYAAMIRFAAPHFIAQRSGIIVNTGSASGFGHNGMSNYAAAKEGVLGLTRSAARDLGRYGVRCNMIRPMSHVTGMGTPELLKTNAFAEEVGIPLLGNQHLTFRITNLPDHVAALTTLLCLPCSAHVSGHEFYIAGDEVGRFPEPELVRANFHPGGWTLQALEEPRVRENLLGDLRNLLVREG